MAHWVKSQNRSQLVEGFFHGLFFLKDEWATAETVEENGGMNDDGVGGTCEKANGAALPEVLSGLVFS